MACRACLSVKQLFIEANRAAPNRSKASDGTCASSTQTSQNPNSDHEPDSRGIAHAGDITHDPANGWDCHKRVAQLITRKDPRIKYVIWNKGIWRSYPKPGLAAWTRQDYTGSNPHTKHMHVSVKTENEDDTSMWWPGSWVITPGGDENVGELSGTTLGEQQKAELANINGNVAEIEVGVSALQDKVAALQADMTEIKGKLANMATGGGGTSEDVIVAAVKKAIREGTD